MTFLKQQARKHVWWYHLVTVFVTTFNPVVFTSFTMLCAVKWRFFLTYQKFSRKVAIFDSSEPSLKTTNIVVLVNNALDCRCQKLESMGMFCMYISLLRRINCLYSGFLVKFISFHHGCRTSVILERSNHRTSLKEGHMIFHFQRLFVLNVKSWIKYNSIQEYYFLTFTKGRILLDWIIF